MSTDSAPAREERVPARPVPGAAVLRPLRSRWLLAALLVLVALATVVMWAFLTKATVDATADSLLRGDVPGGLTADLHPGTWNIYAEGPVTIRDVTVTHADGRPVPVTERRPTGAGYERGGNEANLMAEFDIPVGGMSGELRIAATGTTEPGAEGSFAVGAADEFGVIGFQRWGIVALLTVNLSAAVLVVVVPIIRHRRHSTD